MKIHIEIDEETLRIMVLRKLQYDLGNAGDTLQASDIHIQVKSKQNYKAEWEDARFRATLDVETTGFAGWAYQPATHRKA